MFHLYSAVLFYNDITDKIEQVSKNSGTPTAYYTFENISDAETMGIELAAGYEFQCGLSLDLNWYELKTENKTNQALIWSLTRNGRYPPL
ncbi:MAG: TonB-dependent receptor [Thermodesulfobacteriota bacterium]|nr:TonB-dependent receptor [Thermodesulfobacteriota bacterium]